jgi:hypothetical protein
MLKDAIPSRIVRHAGLARKIVPRSLRTWLKGFVPYGKVLTERCRREGEAILDAAARERPIRSEAAPEIGIVPDPLYYHVHHVLACHELNVPYRLVDIGGHDWLSKVRGSGCRAFLIAPSAVYGFGREMYDERIAVMERDLGYRVVPRADELWLWEKKRRMAYWLAAHGVPHPRTRVFYDREEARERLGSVDLPIVIKTDNGASSKGVFVLRDRREALRLADRAFRRGIALKGWERSDRQRGYLIVQDFVPHDVEWRIVRVEDDYVCRLKRRRGDFASGAGLLEWARPPEAMLDFVKATTDAGGFRNMAVDLLESADREGRPAYVVLEMQCLVGARVLPPNEDMGRWRLEPSGWTFEQGDFYRNACANLRVAALVRELAREPRPTGDAAEGRAGVGPGDGRPAVRR